MSIVVVAIALLVAWAIAPVADHLVIGEEPVPWGRVWVLLLRKESESQGRDRSTVILAAIMAVGFGVVIWKIPVNAWPAFGCLVVAMALQSVIDWRTHRLPDVITLCAYVTTVAGLLVSSLTSDSLGQITSALIGSLAGLVLYGIFILVYPTGLGWGDLKFAGLLGFALGWLGLGEYILGMTSAFLFGGLYSLVLLLARKVGLKDGIPLGPWMVAGALLGISFGGSLMR